MSSWLQRLINWVRGFFLRRRLADPESTERSEAEEQLARVIFETNIDPDCVSAGEIRGGCGIKVKHDDAWEWFVHHDYKQAADEAITWLRNQENEDERGRPTMEITTTTQTQMNRHQRRAFNQKRKQKRKAERQARRRP